MVDMDKLDLKAAEAYLISGIYDIQLCRVKQLMLSELALDKTYCQPCSIDGNVHLFKQKRQSADVILVSVSDENTLYLVGVLHRIRKIGYYKVYAEHIRVGKSKTAIDKYHISLTLVKSHIFTDLVKSSEEGNIYRSIVLFCLFSAVLTLSGFSLIALRPALLLLRSLFFAVRIFRISFLACGCGRFGAFTLCLALRSLRLVFCFFCVCHL